MRYIIDKLPTTIEECPFCQPSISNTEFMCNHNYPNQCLCSLFTACPFPPKPGECNGFIELAAALKKGVTNA